MHSAGLIPRPETQVNSDSEPDRAPETRTEIQNEIKEPATEGEIQAFKDCRLASKVGRRLSMIILTAFSRQAIAAAALTTGSFLGFREAGADQVGRLGLSSEQRTLFTLSRRFLWFSFVVLEVLKRSS